jgi:hypothetical protein
MNHGSNLMKNHHLNLMKNFRWNLMTNFWKVNNCFLSLRMNCGPEHCYLRKNCFAMVNSSGLNAKVWKNYSAEVPSMYWNVLAVNCCYCEVPGNFHLNCSD